jgi:Protein of unknown function (DUF3489)
MSTISTDTITKSKREEVAQRVSSKKLRGAQKSAAAVAEPPKPAEAQFEEHTTKQERMLTLLSRKEGASIAEMMQATKWQQHSVRGFLAGTVKKKLGFQLTSSKEKDGARRYYIATRHGR